MGSELVMHNLDDVNPLYPGAYRTSDPTRYAEDDAASAPKRHQVEQIQRFAGLGIGLSSLLAENVLSHPWISLRRQCQVHHHSAWYHLTPFTLFPVVYNLHRHQSLLNTWKGLGSTFVVRGISLVSEAAVSEFTPCPREITRHSSLKKISQHILLKSISCMISTPFQAASLMETVQSEVVNDKVNLLDTVKEGFWRIYSADGHSSLLMPVWKLWPMTVLYGVSHYVIKSLVQYVVMLVMRVDSYNERSPENSAATSNMADRYYPELIATFMGGLLADVILYPLETVLHRLLLQGTRSIIDNTDNGLDVLPINTRYDGFSDCVNTISRDEGLTGFYKGFGALVLQYTIHYGLLKMTKFLFDQITEHLSDRSDRRR